MINQLALDTTWSSRNPENQKQDLRLPENLSIVGSVDRQSAFEPAFAGEAAAPVGRIMKAAT